PMRERGAGVLTGELLHSSRGAGQRLLTPRPSLHHFDLGQKVTRCGEGVVGWSRGRAGQGLGRAGAGVVRGAAGGLGAGAGWVRRGIAPTGAEPAARAAYGDGRRLSATGCNPLPRARRPRPAALVPRPRLRQVETPLAAQRSGTAAPSPGAATPSTAPSASSINAAAQISGTTAAEIAGSVRALVERGELAPGDLLPPVRALAEQLGVNRNTAVAAYRRLARDGAVTTHGRAGTRIALPAHVAQEGFAAADEPAAGVPAGTLRDLGSGNPDPAFIPDLAPA